MRVNRIMFALDGKLQMCACTNEHLAEDTPQSLPLAVGRQHSTTHVSVSYERIPSPAPWEPSHSDVALTKRTSDRFRIDSIEILDEKGP